VVFPDGEISDPTAVDLAGFTAGSMTDGFALLGAKRHARRQVLYRVAAPDFDVERIFETNRVPLYLGDGLWAALRDPDDDGLGELHLIEEGTGRDALLDENVQLELLTVNDRWNRWSEPLEGPLLYVARDPEGVRTGVWRVDIGRE
jgi:hypothetical protein